jgi:hypothetical protein
MMINEIWTGLQYSKGPLRHIFEKRDQICMENGYGGNNRLWPSSGIIPILIRMGVAISQFRRVIEKRGITLV